MSFSGSKSYSGLSIIIDGAVNFFEAFQGSEYVSLSLSLTGEIFTQKSDNLFNKKKERFTTAYTSLKRIKYYKAFEWVNGN